MRDRLIFLAGGCRQEKKRDSWMQEAINRRHSLDTRKQRPPGLVNIYLGLLGMNGHFRVEEGKRNLLSKQVIKN